MKQRRRGGVGHSGTIYCGCVCVYVGFWNINGLKNKLEKDNVLQWMSKHDIVVLSEIHRATVKHAPGFVPIVAKNDSPTHRGGLVVLFKHSIYPEVFAVDKSVPEQVWFRLRCIPDVQFCGAYVAPADSTYFNESSLAEIQAKTSSDEYHYVIVGDLNARCGDKVHELVHLHPGSTYHPMDSSVNSNGRDITQICMDNSLLVLNNLVFDDRWFRGALTFRRHRKWISEIDLCLVSPELLSCTKNLCISQDTSDPSDHAPVSVAFNFTPDLIHPRTLLARAENTCGHAVLMSNAYESSLCRKPIPMHHINSLQFCEHLEVQETPLLTDGKSVDMLCTEFSNAIYHSATNSKSASPPVSYSQELSRWQRIIDCDDPKMLWRAIDWKGEFDPAPEKQKPSDLEFQTHLEKLLNPVELEDVEWPTVLNHVGIPLLDDPITEEETTRVINKQLKPHKIAGPDGNSPGTFHLLPTVWLTFLITLLNLVFCSSYPVAWSKAKLSMLFKKGNCMDTGNYRGISVIDSISKLYDYILNNRLITWYTPQREQAGGQAKRSCTEHVLTLRLWMDYCKRKRHKLFICFIDFSKAYDRVPRGKLFALLMSLGCGSVMLCALMSMYSVTSCILGTVLITCTIGVRQGSPTSVFLFIIYVDVLIKMIKSRSVCDGFLSWVHLLMLMDDTVIFATSRKKLEEKLAILKEYCDEYGMIVNEVKTEFMVVNGSPCDREVIVVNGMIVKHCTSYVYLGVIVTENGSATTSLKAHVTEKKKHLNRLLIFLSRNHDAPFFVKRKVFDAAFSTAILYGCESWLNVSLEPVERMYMSAVRSLLDVRQSTPKLTCLLEAGIPSVRAVVKDKQSKFLRRMFEEREDLSTTDPLMYTLEFMRTNNTQMFDYIHEIMSRDDHLISDRTDLCQQLHETPPERTKLRLYLAMNPELSVHPLYKVTDSKSSIDDNLRITFSRIRLCSHRLRSETGRWSRVPPEQRFCPHCDNQAVQDEWHILRCPSTHATRTEYGVDTTDLVSLFVNPSKTELLCLKYVMKTLESSSSN